LAEYCVGDAAVVVDDVAVVAVAAVVDVQQVRE